MARSLLINQLDKLIVDLEKEYRFYITYAEEINSKIAVLRKTKSIAIEKLNKKFPQREYKRAFISNRFIFMLILYAYSHFNTPLDVSNINELGGKMLHSKGKILPKITMNEIKLKEQLSVALRKEMHSQYWTGKMIANALGISERTVKDWVAGKRFPNGIDLMNLMTLSPQVREFIWDSTKSENDHIDKQIIKAVFRDFLEDVIERL